MGRWLGAFVVASAVVLSAQTAVAATWQLQSVARSSIGSSQRGVVPVGDHVYRCAARIEVATARCHCWTCGMARTGLS